MFLHLICTNLIVHTQFVAKEGDTVTPGTKIAFISKSDSSDTHVTPSEKPDHDTPKFDAKGAEKAKSNVEEQIKEKPNVVAEVKEKPKVTSPAPPKLSASEPQLPPKERERRVSLNLFFKIFCLFICSFASGYVVIFSTNFISGSYAQN